MKDRMEEKRFPLTDGNRLEQSNWNQSKWNQSAKGGFTQLSNGSLTCSFSTERYVSCFDLLVILDTPDKEPVLVLMRANNHKRTSLKWSGIITSPHDFKVKQPRLLIVIADQLRFSSKQFENGFKWPWQSSMKWHLIFKSWLKWSRRPQPYDRSFT